MQNKNEWIRKLGEQVEILVAEPMKNHTTFRIGGPADALALPKTPEEVAEVVHFCHEHAQPYYVLGNGSNLLVSDEGYRGLVLQLYRNFNDIQVNGETITVQSGAMLAAVARTAYQTGLTGPGICLWHSGNDRRRSRHECGCLWRRDEKCAKRSDRAHKRRGGACDSCKSFGAGISYKRNSEKRGGSYLGRFSS